MVHRYRHRHRERGSGLRRRRHRRRHRAELGLDPNDPDTDDDGVIDGADGLTDTDGDGLIDALDADSDNDGLNDGTERGVTADMTLPGTDKSSPNFQPDGDPSTTTDPAQPGHRRRRPEGWHRGRQPRWPLRRPRVGSERPRHRPRWLEGWRRGRMPRQPARLLGRPGWSRAGAAPPRASARCFPWRCCSPCLCCARRHARAVVPWRPGGCWGCW